MTVSAEFTGVGASPASAVLPVAFFDGDREVDVGTVLVDSTMRFKRFQSVVSQKIGILPNQISLSLVRARKGRSSPEIRRKTPIDEGSDFGSIAKDRDCKVVAVLKRSRRARARRNHVDGRSVEDMVVSKENVIRVPEKTILRRPSPELMGSFGLGLGFSDFEALMNLQIQRERLLAAAKAAAAPPFYPYAEKPAINDYRDTAAAPLFYPYAERTLAENYRDDGLLGSYDCAGGGVSVCQVCEGAGLAEEPPPFHLCVHDAVTFGFRSSVGPIERPAKAPVDDSAA